MVEFLPIVEEFYSIQGEGNYSGSPSYFIRLAGCDVGCHWCDVKESWEEANHLKKNIEQIVKDIPSQTQRVIITGGEPTMWNLTNLTLKLKDRNLKINLETSGVNSILGQFDWICLSPKKNKLPLRENYRKAHELKVIIYNKDDFKFAEEQAKLVDTKCVLYLQPEWSRKDLVFPKIFEYILDNPKWRLSTQVHKFWNVD